MGFRLTARETVPDGIKRIAWEQADRAIHELGSDTLEQSKRIHQARKRFKKVRAILRLARFDLGNHYHYENRWFRDAGRELSETRDAHVLIQTFDKLLAHFGNQLNSNAFTETRSILVTRCESLKLSTSELDWIVAELIANLSTALDRIYTWPLSRHGFPALKNGLLKTYNRGYKGFRQAYKTPSTETFHEWRNRTKYLRYHTRILHNLWPEIMIGYQSSFEHLTDILGDNHDLALLRRTLVASPGNSADRNVQVLFGLIDRRQSELRDKARPLGMRLYAESPNRFVSRMENYWETWQTEERQKLLAATEK